MTKSLDQYSNPFDAVRDFEIMLAKFTGAPYVIVTDCCTHAMEIALRIEPPRSTVSFPGRTYLSVVMLMHKLGIDYTLTDDRWKISYKLSGTRIKDCARHLEVKSLCASLKIRPTLCTCTVRSCPKLI